MSRTERRNYRGEWGRESRHWWGKRCPEPNCPACHTGREKRTWNRLPDRAITEGQVVGLRWEDAAYLRRVEA